MDRHAVAFASRETRSMKEVVAPPASSRKYRLQHKVRSESGYLKHVRQHDALSPKLSGILPGSVMDCIEDDSLQ